MIKIPRIKLQWATSAATPGDWYLGLFGRYARQGGRGRGLAVSIRGVLLWGAAAGLAAYFTGAAYVYWRLERRPYNFVRYSDILLYPIRFEKIEKLRGQAIIAAGFDTIKAGQWYGGVNELRMGLERYPQDLKARLEVAKFFIAAKVRPKSQEVLLGGLAFGYTGRTYLEAAIGMASAGEDFELILTICDRALALAVASPEFEADRRWLVEQRLRALLSQERSDEALAYAEAEMATVESSTLNELRLLALIQAKRLEEAVAFGEAWRARVGDDAQVLRLLVRVYREAGHLDKMEGILSELRRARPADPRIRVFAIIQYLLAGDEAKGRELIDDFIFRMGGAPENFALLAEPLAEIKRGRELEVVIAAAAERGVADFRISVAKLQSFLNERRWAEAARLMVDMRASLPADSPGRIAMLDLIQILVAAAADPAEGTQTSLTNYIAVRQLPMAGYRQIIEVLKVAKRTATARETVRLAQGVFPTNRYLMKMKAELDAELASASAVAEAGRTDKVVRPAFATSEGFYKELDEVTATRANEAGLALLRELRAASPNWVAGEGEPLARRELELSAQGNDFVELKAAAQRYVNDDRVRITTAIGLATRLHSEGRDEQARLILDEILRRLPGNVAATRLKSSWFPPKPVDPELAPSASGAKPALENPPEPKAK